MAGGLEGILLVKIGGSSITKKAELETLDPDALDWFSKSVRSNISGDFLDTDNEITIDDSAKQSIIIVHGAGSFGHHTAKKYGLRGASAPPADGMSLTRDLKTGIAQTRHSVKKLNAAVVSNLIENGVNAVGISPCLNIPGLMAHGGDEYNGATILIQAIRETLNAGLVPVIHGDAGLNGTYHDPSSERNGFRSISAGILGGDTLVEIIATHPLMKNAISKTVFLTDVEGVFTKDPKTFPDATLLRNVFIDPVSGKVINELSASGSSHEHDVTGGLEAKLGAAATIAKEGVDVVVAKCGTHSAEIAIREKIATTNTNDHTVVRVKQT